MSEVERPAFDGERCKALLRARGIGLGEPLFVMATTASTNDDALNAAKASAAHGSTFLAEQQTAGRGRRGRRWSSPRGENLTFSVLLRPRIRPEQAGAFALAVGLAAREVVARRVPTPIGIKWPNDLCAGSRKIAGVLVESQIQSGSVAALVVGIGLNVHMQRMPGDIADSATSLALLGATDLDRERLLCELLELLEQRLETYVALGLLPLLPELRAHDVLYGQRVRVEQALGTARGIDESGALLLETEGGQLLRVFSGTVERLPAP
jgi:BirA family biotin operon repressor/biotin-[acetyl-CoA-carboxylase] ligase